MNKALKTPVTKNVWVPKGNPLDESTHMQATTQKHLAATDNAEHATTPEAEVMFAQLTEEEQEETSAHTGQSTLSGATFHTTRRSTRLGDGDESQDWQIRQVERGTGQTEH